MTVRDMARKVRPAISIKSYMEIIVMIAAGLLAWPLVSNVSALALMRFVYPALVALHLFADGVLWWRYRFINPATLIPSIRWYIRAQMMGYLLLALTTGNNPLLSIDDFRYLVVYSRFLSLAAICLISAVGLCLIVRGIRNVYSE